MGESGYKAGLAQPAPPGLEGNGSVKRGTYAGPSGGSRRFIGSALVPGVEPAGVSLETHGQSSSGEANGQLEPPALSGAAVEPPQWWGHRGQPDPGAASEHQTQLCLKPKHRSWSLWSPCWLSHLSPCHSSLREPASHGGLQYPWPLGYLQPAGISGNTFPCRAFPPSPSSRSLVPTTQGHFLSASCEGPGRLSGADLVPFPPGEPRVAVLSPK